jgi:Pyridoxamine 5'-phosphate oxidase
MDDEIYFTVHPESVLFRNIAGNDRIAISICDSIHAVMCQGRAVRVGTAAELSGLIGELASLTRGGTFTPPGWEGFVYRVELRRLVAN